MITFLDENDAEYGALATIKATNAVNGERSITGEIISGDIVLSRIERGWRLRFEDEYYVVTFAKPIDEGKNVQVSFDAVHQFFWDFGKSSVYDQLSDGSHTFRAYLDFIFNGSGYRYDIESSLTVKAFEKQSFGYKNRLSLFNDIITSSGVEFQVNGKVVRILAKVGTDLSTVVRKNFNLNELGIEKNIGDFVTYQKGFGAYFDEEDHSKGRLIAEYTSPLASVYGKLEADPLVDERYKQSESLLSALKETVDNSYTISVSLDMEDLTRAGYRYTQPVAGDYIMAINETLGFKEKIRIVSFTSEYDVSGQLIKHTVTCNDIGSVKKLSASYTQTQHQAANAEVNANTAYEFANKALVSANGKNTNYYGDTFPVDNPKGTLKKGDLLFLTVGDTVKQYYWNGADWVINPVLDDVEAFKEQIADELKDVPNREEFENKISEELANSKAEIETQIETAKTQAESNAKEYADTINQETTKVAELANAAAGEIKADLVNVKNNLTATSLVANNAQASVDKTKQDLTNSVAAVNTKVDSTKAELTQAKQDLTKVTSDLNTAKQDLTNSLAAVNTKADSTKAELTQAKQDLTSHAQQLQTQANAQTELTNRVTTVETTANGTKTTVSELSKTVAQNGKDITSVTARTKVVEDDLAGTKTTLSQVKTTADSTSQKTATLETGLNGLNARFDSLSVGGGNLIKQLTAQKGLRLSMGAKPFQDQAHSLSDWIKIEPNTTYTLTTYEDVDEGSMYYSLAWYSTNNADYSGWISRPTGALNAAGLKGGKQYTSPANAAYAKVSYPTKYSKVKLERGNVATDYSQNGVDLEQKIAEYKQNADQNYASLQTTVQKLDGTVQHNKTVAEQTAEGFKTRIESLETYKDGETTRANQYFESAKTETARQLTVERTAIAKDYVAKSTYTSDVAGIRNELSATTTTANTIKTNLANYQATNNRAVANLQSNIQTANGDISSLKTKVEAVPGQITSAVSAVEGKIPTSVGATNLLLYSADPSKAPARYYDFTSAQKTSEIYNGSVVYKTQGIWSGIRVNLGNLVDRGLLKVGDVLTYSVAMRAEQKTPIQARLFIRYTNQSDAYSPTNKLETVTLTTDWQYVSVTFTVTAKMLAANTKVTFLGWELTSNAETGKYVYYACNKLERGNVATGYSPAPEDTATQISSLSSEIKQTADGITLLAKKTELNTAKNELQSDINTATNKANSAQNTANSAQNTANSAQTTANSNAQTISTHTTQISVLNTGLNAKVSQTDFNALSGRVTTAENKITAKADELSSKISSVEGKLPTSIDTVNLVKGTGSSFVMGYGITNTTWNETKKQTILDFSAPGVRRDIGDEILPQRELFFNFKPIKGVTYTQSIMIDTDATFNPNGQAHCSWFTTKGHNQQKAYIKKVGNYSYQIWSTYTWNLDDVALRAFDWCKLHNILLFRTTGTYLAFYKPKLTSGNLPSDWSPSPEDYDNTITRVSTEIKQTADGLKQLSTQVTSQGSTITSHTNSINSLTTGLSAKVSQTDFNKLSGRVTTAENNITAKANELSSKITSVEGKIPTELGVKNLIKQSTAKAGTRLPPYAGEYQDQAHSLSDWIKIEPNTTYTLTTYEDVDEGSMYYSLAWYSTNNADYSGWISRPTGALNAAVLKGGKQYTSPANAAYAKVSYPTKYSKVKLERGKVSTDYTPAPEDYDSKLASVQSEIKQTTDSITASVQSLDNSTVKSSSLTINTDGVVIKAGKSPSDFANAIGSYFSVNQNAINLFSDKINVKGNMIVSGAITSDKIASKQINTAHLNGKIITADVISSNAVTADAIKAGAVTTNKMSANSINGDRITAGTLDAAKIKAGSITASQIASGTITSNQIKAGTISAANIAAGAITSDKIASNSIDASKIAANAITANMIRGGQLRSTNGATVFDLNAGTLTFNNNVGYIQRIAGDKIFEITTVLGQGTNSQDFLTSDFTIRKSDFSRQAGAKFTLYSMVENKPTARATIHADELVLFDSQKTTLLSILAKGSFSNFNFQGWGDIPVAQLPSCGLIVKDIGIGGYTKSLQKIVEELCRKTGVLWI